MTMPSLRDQITLLETRLDQRDDAFRQATSRITALEILTAHLKPKRPPVEPVPGPGPGDPPRKNVRRMVVVDPTATNGQHTIGCAYCGKLLCSSLDPKCERAKRMVGWRA